MLETQHSSVEINVFSHLFASSSTCVSSLLRTGKKSSFILRLFAALLIPPRKRALHCTGGARLEKNPKAGKKKKKARATIRESKMRWSNFLPAAKLFFPECSCLLVELLNQLCRCCCPLLRDNFCRTTAKACLRRKRIVVVTIQPNRFGMQLVPPILLYDYINENPTKNCSGNPIPIDSFEYSPVFPLFSPKKWIPICVSAWKGKPLIYWLAKRDLPMHGESMYYYVYFFHPIDNLWFSTQWRFCDLFEAASIVCSRLCLR